MGLLNRISRFGTNAKPHRHAVHSLAHSEDKMTAWRICRFELMEPRRLLAVDVLPIQAGCVYCEDATGEDVGSGDTFWITFSGGATGTQLTELSIETDKEIDGLTIGDCFFDIDDTQEGAFGYVDFSDVNSYGVTFYSHDVEDGGTVLTLSFVGFEAGDTFRFSIDVDEQGFLGPNAVAEGNEFEGSRLRATFEAEHYLTATDVAIFYDAYDDALAASGLDLPPDDYTTVSEEPMPIQTAGAFMVLTQEPLPITLSGTVFEDTDRDLVQDATEPGIEGVTLTLYELVDGQYTATGMTTQTDTDGYYQFEGLLPGEYRVVETQPEGYLDVGAVAGTVDGDTRGTISGTDIITNVELQGGEDSIANNFAEVRPAALSGHVYHDANNNGVRDVGEEPIAGVTIFLEQIDGGGGLITFGPGDVLTTTTDANGFWSFDDLMPGEYIVEEIQPDGYLDGLDSAGTLGGTANNPGDSIEGIVLNAGVTGKNYDFGELLPASISGHVYAELNGNCHWESGEPFLPGVTIYLLDAEGNRIQSTLTDADGQYSFTNLAPGTYGVEEIQPDDYYDACDLVGTAGGDNSVNDKITAIDLPSGTDAVDYIFVEIVGATISGYVFQDGPDVMLAYGEQQPDVASIRDGKFTPDDTPLAGVVMKLGDDIGAPILDSWGNPITTVTDARGYYEFTNLPPGTYTVLQVQPEGYVDGIDTAGSEGGIAVNPADNVSALILSQLAVDPKDDAILRINLSVADTAVSYNFSEVRFVQQPPYWPPEDPEPTPRGLDVLSPPPLPEPAPYAVPYARPYIPRELGYGGSGLPTATTWHLSVINGGQPRSNQAGTSAFITVSDSHFNAASWIGTRMDRAVWKVLVSRDIPEEKCRFGFPGAIPVTGDFNGDGRDEVAIFADGQWLIDLNGNGRWDDGDLWAKLGDEGDLPVTGDWDGDGKTDIGIFGAAWVGDPQAIATEPGLPDSQNLPSGHYKNIPPDENEASGTRTLKLTSEGRLRSDVIDHVFQFGVAGDRPVTGDWNGDGVATIGVFRGGVWFLDVDGDGRWSSPDLYIEYGGEDDLPVVGDFNSDGIDDIGVYRAGTWRLDSNGNHQLDAQDKVFEMGGANDQPVVADFDGDGVVEFGVYETGPSVNQQAADQQRNL